MTPLETHAKNLAWIDNCINKSREVHKEGEIRVLVLRELYINALRANRKVLERHAPRERETTPTPNDPFWYKIECSSCVEHETLTEWIYSPFPCLTYTDITKGLGIPNE